MNTTTPYHIIISDAGSNKETIDYLDTLKGIDVLKTSARRSFSETCNAGIRHSYNPYVAILNSDLIVSKDWLKNILDKFKSNPDVCAIGPLSNCDQHWLHEEELKLDDSLSLHPGMTIQELGDKQELLDKKMVEWNQAHKNQFALNDWIAAYCVVFKREALNKVGLFDTHFLNGCEDLDLCRRLSMSGYKMGRALDSFVFHFGGVSRGAYQNENKDKYDKEDVANHQMYKDKWAKKRLIIYTGPAWEKWNEAKVLTGLGGSETWAVMLANAFADNDWDVTILNDIEQKEITSHGVKYAPYQEMQDVLQYQYLDMFISSRTVDPYKTHINALKRYVMVHDVFINQDQNLQFPDQIDRIYYLSDWHKDFLINYHKNIPKDKLFKTHNGVDFNLYKDIVPKQNQMVWSSSLDRGLDTLIEMVPRIKALVPDFTLIVAYGLYNWKEAAKSRGSKEELAKISNIEHLLSSTEGVVYKGRVSKAELASLQLSSKVWCYPTWFSETFCITAVENGLSRNAIVCTDLAGLKTTVGNAGILLELSDNYWCYSSWLLFD
jgi:GT2 family glycosyltransferase